MGLIDVVRGWFSDPPTDGTDDAESESHNGSDETPSTPGDSAGPDPAVATGPGTGDSDRTVVYECRNCGTTVSPETSTCPTCGSDAIAEYPIE